MHHVWVDVPGAKLHATKQGSGPVLLVLQGGAAGAEGADAIAERLPDFTVVSYDRRGLGTSALLTPQAGHSSVATHADDARRVLEAVTNEPALAVGVSIGAVIGLELAARYGDRVKALVAFEPPLDALRTGEAREHAVRVHGIVSEASKRHGPMGAMRAFLQNLGIDFQDAEPGITFTPNPRMVSNAAFFVEHDIPGVRAHVPDINALKKTATEILCAVGTATLAGAEANLMHAAPVRALAEALGKALIEFPGGHNGYVSRPSGWASRLRDVLAPYNEGR